MVVLLLDTSNKYLSVGIVKDNELIYKLQYEAWQRQSEYMANEVDKALKECGLTPKDLTGIAVSKGPGSYTGLRIALTLGKVLAYSLNIPIMAFSSLQTLAGLTKNALVLMDARSNRAYVGEYNEGKQIKEDCIKTIDEIKEYIKKGNYTLLGDTHLLNLNENEIDIITNMKDLLSVGKWINDVNLIQPQYLKG